MDLQINGQIREAQSSIGWQRIGSWLFLGLAALLLCLPALLQMGGYVQKPLGENRVMAALPATPANMEELKVWPRKVDSWLADHFGLRDRMVIANANIRYRLLGSFSSRQLTAGQDGYVFFNSHSASDPNGAIFSLCGVPAWSDPVRKVAPDLARFLDAMRARHTNSVYFMVPSRLTLYPEKLPQWIQDHCAPYEGPTLPTLAAASKATAAADQLVYPLEMFQERKATHQVYPKTHFHWVGETPHWAAGWIAEKRFHRTALRDLPVKRIQVGSDVGHFMPGIKLLSDSLLPDYATAGIDACNGAGCYPDLDGLPDRLLDVSRYRAKTTNASRTERGPRLLILSDSFGHFIAGFFSAYYDEVRHIAANHLSQLNADERQQLMRAMFEDYAPDDVLYLFHDGALILTPMLKSLMFEAQG